LLGPTRAHILAIALMGDLHSLGYSREAESNADVTGSDICAAAGYNPWGSFFPIRIQTLEKRFRDNPSVFAKFNSDPKSATPFSAPKDAPEQFLPCPPGHRFNPMHGRRPA
jgi:beta-barrel assembly-enhancing protease